MIYRYFLWLCIGSAVLEVLFPCRAESNAVLPDGVALQLRRQATALQTSHLEFTQTKVEGNKLTRLENYAVESDGARFTQQIKKLTPSTGQIWGLFDNSFDGSSLFYYGNPKNPEATGVLAREPDKLMIHSIT